MIVGAWSTLVIRGLVLIGLMSAFMKKNTIQSLTLKADEQNTLHMFPNAKVEFAFQTFIILTTILLSIWFIFYWIKNRRLDGFFVYIILDTALCLSFTYFLIYIFISLFDENNLNHEISKALWIFMTFLICEYEFG